jgi:hypothetical protein
MVWTESTLTVKSGASVEAIDLVMNPITSTANDELAVASLGLN